MGWSVGALPFVQVLAGSPSVQRPRFASVVSAKGMLTTQRIIGLQVQGVDGGYGLVPRLKQPVNARKQMGDR